MTDTIMNSAATMTASKVLRTDRLANAPFQLMKTPVHAQNGTVSDPSSNYSTILTTQSSHHHVSSQRY